MFPGVVRDRIASSFPEPWRVVVSELLTEVSLYEVAQRMPEGEAQSSILEGYSARVSEIIDDYCGTGWRRRIPVAGPRPWVLPAVKQLAAAAHSLQEGREVRDEEIRTSSGVVDVDAG